MNVLSDEGRSAMRKLNTANFITINSLRVMPFLILLGGSVALAQNSGRMGNSKTSGTAPQSSSNSGSSAEAPIGHRQPRAGDVPQGTGADLNAEDAALDRKIKSICRGC